MAEEQPELQLGCYEKAQAENMPNFTLIASDPLAPHLVALWSALSKGDVASALTIFSDTVSDPGYRYRYNRRTAEKIQSANQIATEMQLWRKEKGLEVYTLYVVSFI